MSASPSRSHQLAVVREAMRVNCMASFTELLNGYWSIENLNKLIKVSLKSNSETEPFRVLPRRDLLEPREYPQKGSSLDGTHSRCRFRERPPPAERRVSECGGGGRRNPQGIVTCSYLQLHYIYPIIVLMTSSSASSQLLVSLINFLAQTPAREKVTPPPPSSVVSSSISRNIWARSIKKSTRPNRIAGTKCWPK